MPTIRRVMLFGSLISGIPTPRSDADLLVEVTSSEHPRPQDRIPEVLRALASAPCPLDLFVYESEELARLAEVGDPVVTQALSVGRDLLQVQA